MDKVKGMAEDLGKEEGVPGELIWSFLKYKTKGEAAKIVNGVAKNRGLEAWRRLL